MPKLTKDYSLACIYELKVDDKCVYVGSTSKFNTRFDSHRYAFKKMEKNLYIRMRDELGISNWDDVGYHLIEKYPITSGSPLEMKRELEKREGEWVAIHRPVLNKNRPAYPEKLRRQEYAKDNAVHIADYQKEYRKENAERIAEQYKASYEAHKPERLAKMKVYADEHRDSIKEYKAQWHQDNKDKIAKQCKERYQENRDSIQEERKKPWTCDQCEKTLTIQHKTRHLKSCKGEVKLVDPDTLFECPNCKQMKGKKHKSRHLKTCIALEKSEVL